MSTKAKTYLDQATDIATLYHRCGFLRPEHSDYLRSLVRDLIDMAIAAQLSSDAKDAAKVEANATVGA